MKAFESGVLRYVEGRAEITVYFPVDCHGNADICCRQCPYLSANERICQLNKEPVAYPSRYVGDKCPLRGDGLPEQNEGE